MTKKTSSTGLLWTLLWCTVLCSGLIALRMVITEEKIYRWLVIPNLVLAWIPYGLSAWLGRLYRDAGRLNTRIGLIGAAWLFFYPNCSYILTDLIHLGRVSKLTHPAILHYDLLINILAAATGWLLGVVSLHRLHEVVRKSKGTFWGHAFAAVVLLLGSIGVYLGRFMRWNTWDLLTRPMQIVTDTVDAIGNRDALVFILVFAAVTGTLYFALYNWKRTEY